MKKSILVSLILLSFLQMNAQEKWFFTQTDSVQLVTSANQIVQQMAKDIQKVFPAIDLKKNKPIKHTTPYLIYIDLEKHTVNLPLWSEVIPEQKQFFAEVAGGEQEGKDVFGLFFNGFYLTHELGHALAEQSGKKFGNAYDSEYDANKIAMLYWMSVKEEDKLLKCYTYAKKMLRSLKNPVPPNNDPKKYITDHYEELSSDPYKYGYIQFSQFVEIYEGRNEKNLGQFLQAYLSK
jgi:hypothetical protein